MSTLQDLRDDVARAEQMLLLSKTDDDRDFWEQKMAYYEQQLEGHPDYYAKNDADEYIRECAEQCERRMTEAHASTTPAWRNEYLLRAAIWSKAAFKIASDLR